VATTISHAPQLVPPDAAKPRRPRLLVTGDQGRRLWLPVAVLAALGAGVSALLSFPPYDQWWLAPISVAALGAACHRRRFRAGFGLGMLAGIAFFFPLLSWTSTQVGQVPWIALSLLESLYLALLGGALAFAGRFVDRHRSLWPVMIAALWTGQEALRDRTPFGGFPWGRLAFSQADSPIGFFAWLAGAPAVTFITAGCGGLLLSALWRGWTPADRRGWRHAAVFGAVAAIVAMSGLAVPTTATRPVGEEVTVAVVQGSVPRLGLDFNSQRRAVLDNHVRATVDLAAEVADGRSAQPDVVVWPENSSDIDPVANPDAARRIDQAAKAIGVPIVVGTVQREGDRNLNVSMVWDPHSGPGFRYVKQHPVPFAEYIPIKPVVRTVAGWIDDRMVDGIDRVNGFVPGEEPGVIPVAGLTVSGIICFEVAYDDLVRESVTEGAQILAVQTNNATFDSSEASQQLAMVQLRSIEHGRAGLMASTVGISAFTEADGTVHDATKFDTQEVIVSSLALGDTTTPATVVGVVPELLACLVALGVLIASLRRRRAPEPGGAVEASD
jgi:apolipoprotein N-acyltransferase